MTKKAASSAKTRQKTSSFGKTFDRVVQVSVVVLIALIAIVTYHADGIRAAISNYKAGKVAQPTDIAVKPKSRSNSTFPNYEEYIDFAVENGWNPVDPLEKLNATVQKYSQIYDLNRNDTDKQFDSYVNMLNKEILFLMEVFKQSSDRQIDLTPAMFLVLDVAQQSIYSIMKHKLNVGSRLVTRTTVSKNYAQWIYPASRELMKFALPSDGKKTNTSHVFLDFHRRSNGHSLLTKAVQYRLYGIISVLASYSPDSMGDALAYAIHNGDDLAAALLIKQDETTGYLLSDPTYSVEEFISMAETHKYTSLIHRLSTAFGSSSSKDATITTTAVEVDPSEEASARQARLVERAAKAGAVNEKLPIYQDHAPSISVPRASTANAEKTSSTATNGDGVSGYDDFVMARITGTNDTDLPQCDIDRVSLQDLTLEKFHREYVMTNRPVVITVESATAAAEGNNELSGKPAASNSLDVWNLSRLLSKYGDDEVVVSVIPYGTLFGRGEISMTLREYVQSDKRGMKAFTEQLKGMKFKNESDTRSLILLKMALAPPQLKADWRHSLPLYIFSGDKQKLNSRMVSDFVTTIKSYGKTEGSEENVTPLLAQLLLSVSTNDTSTVQGISKRAFKVPLKTWKFQFFLGPALSGAPLHHHAPAFNFLLHGQKVWTLLTPGRDVYSNLHPLEWLDAGGIHWKSYPYSTDKPPAHVSRETSRPCEVVQKSGEVVFVPRHWTHQVLNQAESVGFAVEIQDYIY